MFRRIGGVCLVLAAAALVPASCRTPTEITLVL